jgi:WD40 repeat protein
LFSGSADSTITLWKEVANSEWVHSHTKKEHSQDILCIVLNSNEDQLLSCSYDKSIKAWKVNYFENNLEFDYTLD